MDVKNIDTDGEMSVYATAGHNGVLIVSLNADITAINKGLQQDDVIVVCGRTKINSVEDFANCADALDGTVTILRKQIMTVLGA